MSGTKPGLRASFFADYSAQWGRPFYGIESGGYHCYGGPGALFLRFGVGELVLEIEYPRCS